MQRKMVLVVDDEDITRQAYAALLEESGYRVVEAENGGEAIRRVHEHAPDVILMDILMPVVSGIEAAESLKGLQATADIPIIAITGASQRVPCEQMQRICDDLLRKPCSAEEILMHVAAQLDHLHTE